MRSKELDAVLAYLRQLMADTRLDDAQKQKVRKGVREFEKLRRSGQLDQRRLYRAISLIASVLVEMLPDTEPAGSPDIPGSDAMSRVNR